MAEGGEPQPTPARRAGKRRASNSHTPRWRRLLSWKALGFAVLGFLLLVTIAIGVAWATIKVPEPNDFSTSETTIVYYDDGKTEMGRFSVENRVIVDAEDIPDALKNAVVAAEDRSFYGNPGFDIKGIGRAAWEAVSGSARQSGGSTITQQYVKNYYLTQERSISRKLKEVVIAVKIDQAEDKDHILASYLNTIWLGRGTYGVETASQSYFGKSVRNLNLRQSVAMAAFLRSPNSYDPTLSDENAAKFQDRFQYVLDGMVETGAIDQDTADNAKPPKVKKQHNSNTYGGSKGHLLQMVRTELADLGFDAAEIDTGGLRVVTTFDKDKQDAAVQAVEEERPTEDADRLHVGLAAVEPGTGAVVAAYGGPNAVKQTFNDATAKVQIGSTAKAFSLVAALENDRSLWDGYYGNSPLAAPTLGKEPVNNYGDLSYGSYVSLLTATRQSINTAFVDLAMDIGPDTIVDAQVAAGIPQREDFSADPRVTLGIQKVTPIELAGSYATLAAQGVQADPYIVKRVKDSDGAVRHKNDGGKHRVFETDVMADVTYALTNVVTRGTGTQAQALGRPAAGKTGTHEELSAWFAGYTPQLAASVAYFRGEGNGIGTESLDGVAGMSTFTGGEYPARTWTAFMSAALEDEEVENFPSPVYKGYVPPAPDPDEDDEGDEGGSESGDEGGDESGDENGDESGDENGDEAGDEGTDTGTDTGTDAGTDTGDEGTDTGTDTGTDVGTDLGTDEP